MSRIGQKPISIPAEIDISVKDNLITVRGPRGSLQRRIHDRLQLELKDNQLTLQAETFNRHTRAMWGTERALIANMIQGVNSGYQRALEIEGVGFRANVQDDVLELNIGFSHAVKYRAPQGIIFKVEKNTIFVSGIDKQLVGRVAAEIRKLRPPDPYKAKGIRYQGEVIKKKAGKKAVAAG